MAAILLDVDGVLHVSGEAIRGAADAVARLRSAGHRLRFITNSTTRSQAGLADDLRAQGIELDDEELQTTAAVAAHTLAGKRVLALTMPSLADDLAGKMQLVGFNVDAVLIGGLGEDPEQNARVFSYPNIARAFAEVEAGADFYCLHKNRWWQTKHGPMLDSGAFVAGIEYAAEAEATILGKPTAAYFDAALAALDADAGMTWMVGDDVESDIAGAQACGLRTVLVRTGKFRPEHVERSAAHPDGIVSSIAQVPEWIEEHL